MTSALEASNTVVAEEAEEDEEVESNDWVRETEEEIKEAATASVGASTSSTRGGS